MIPRPHQAVHQQINMPQMHPDLVFFPDQPLALADVQGLLQQFQRRPVMSQLFFYDSQGGHHLYLKTRMGQQHRGLADPAQVAAGEIPFAEIAVDLCQVKPNPGGNTRGKNRSRMPEGGDGMGQRRREVIPVHITLDQLQLNLRLERRGVRQQLIDLHDQGDIFVQIIRPAVNLFQDGIEAHHQPLILHPGEDGQRFLVIT